MVKLTIEITEVATTGRLIINVIPVERKASAHESRGAELLQRTISDVGSLLMKINHNEHGLDDVNTKQLSKIVEEDVKRMRG